MENILIGNGVDIQFGGADYTNQGIIERALNNLKTATFHPNVYPQEVEKWMYLLYGQLPLLLNGEYDKFAVIGDEKEELRTFRNTYNTGAKISDIGFEYFFLIHSLFCRKEKIVNPERFHIQESLRRVFLDAIYNEGNINLIHLKFPPRFVEFLCSFNQIFTTNYDSNIANATNREVNYLHGAFHFLDPVYDINSLRNRIADKPALKTPPVKGYEHCYSNAVTGSTGNFKLFSVDQPGLVNSGLEKLAKGYLENPELRPEIDSWENDENPMINNLHQAIMLKISEPDVEFPIHYAVQKLRESYGRISILGLSPNNDMHIMKVIRDNENLTSIDFYFYDENEKNSVVKFFSNKKVSFKNVMIFWEEIV